MALSDIVSVQIHRETETVDRQNFGIPLFAVESTAFESNPSSPTFAERVRSYSSIDQVADDFDTDDKAFKMALAAFSQEIRPTTIKIGVKNTAENWPTALNAIAAYDDNWYALAIDNPSKAAILLVAEWIQARPKIFIARSSDADVLTTATTDVASELLAEDYTRTALMYHSQAVSEYPDAAILGNCLVHEPGSETWKFKQLIGVPFDKLTATQRSNALAKSANLYIRVAGVNITEEGTMASGEYIDITRGLDWLTARMKERIFGFLANAKKVTFTNKGVASIETLVREQLDFAVDQGVIAPEPPYTVTVPDVLDTDIMDRQNRHLKGITFQARLAGAIHKVDVVGTVTV